MEIILNDYSIDSQFDSVESFVDSLVEYTLPLLDILKSKEFYILKRYDSYNLKITSDLSLYDFLKLNKYNAYAETQKMKSLLVSLSDEPYWQDNNRTDQKSVYKTEFTGEFYGSSPNCFSEALERDKIVFSFEKENFKRKTLKILKNNIDFELHNFYDSINTFDFLYEKSYISFSELLLGYNNSLKISFFCLNGSVIIDNEFDDSNLTIDDAYSIKRDFCKWIEGIEYDNMLPRLTDSIKYKDITYNEFRTTLKNSREFRMFYKLIDNTYVFFNLLLKKSEATPMNTKKRTYDLIKHYYKTD